jgi:hypothetical protein
LIRRHRCLTECHTAMTCATHSRDDTSQNHLKSQHFLSYLCFVLPLAVVHLPPGRLPVGIGRVRDRHDHYRRPLYSQMTRYDLVGTQQHVFFLFFFNLFSLSLSLSSIEPLLTELSSAAALLYSLTLSLSLSLTSALLYNTALSRAKLSSFSLAAAEAEALPSPLAAAVVAASFPKATPQLFLHVMPPPPRPHSCSMYKQAGRQMERERERERERDRENRNRSRQTSRLFFLSARRLARPPARQSRPRSTPKLPSCCFYRFFITLSVAIKTNSMNKCH